MPFRRRKKHMGEVNMSSMTDIIFMLLIFFMLTSTLVKFLPFQLPKSEQRTNASIKTTVSIEKSGKMTLNDRQILPTQLEAALRIALQNAPDKPTPSVTIAAETGVPFEQVTRVMAVANRLKVRTILATEPKE
ncbi:MAG: biopolymer transporter ExbD [Saprospiraceae bacterium]|nr:biopolymer transporter ExbD [Saprospiraceae bacterium]